MIAIFLAGTTNCRKGRQQSQLLRIIISNIDYDLIQKPNQPAKRKYLAAPEYSLESFGSRSLG